MQDVLEIALKDEGLWEWAGEDHNPRILSMFHEAGHPSITDDETAWCAAAVGSWLHRAGYKNTGSLLARSYTTWGEAVALADMQPGDVVVFPRGNSTWQGHVALYVGPGKRPGYIRCLGGNQVNQVNVKEYRKQDLIAVRRGKPMRTNKAQSTTLNAVAVSGGGVATMVVTTLGELSPTSQLVVIGAALVVGLCLGWIARRRIARWAQGDR